MANFKGKIGKGDKRRLEKHLNHLERTARDQDRSTHREQFRESVDHLIGVAKGSISRRVATKVGTGEVRPKKIVDGRMVNYGSTENVDVISLATAAIDNGSYVICYRHAQTGDWLVEKDCCAAPYGMHVGGGGTVTVVTGGPYVVPVLVDGTPLDDTQGGGEGDEGTVDTLVGYGQAVCHEGTFTVFNSTDSNGGSIAWANSSRCAASDDSYADTGQAMTGGETSEYLQALSVTGVTMSGTFTPKDIFIKIEGSDFLGDTRSMHDAECILVKQGVIQSSEVKGNLVSFWPANDVTRVYRFDGSAYTSCRINDTDFGVVFSMKHFSFGEDQEVLDTEMVPIHYDITRRVSDTTEGSTADWSATSSGNPGNGLLINMYDAPDKAVDVTVVSQFNGISPDSAGAIVNVALQIDLNAHSCGTPAGNLSWRFICEQEGTIYYSSFLLTPTNDVWETVSATMLASDFIDQPGPASGLDFTATGTQIRWGIEVGSGVTAEHFSTISMDNFKATPSIQLPGWPQIDQISIKICGTA